MTFRTWIKELEKEFYKDMRKYYTRLPIYMFNYPDGEITEYAWNMAESAVNKLSDEEVKRFAKDLTTIPMRNKYGDITPLWDNSKDIYQAWIGDLDFGSARNRWEWSEMRFIDQLRWKLTAVAGVIIREPMFRMISERVYEVNAWEWWRKKNLKWPNTWGFYHYPED
jgi:hypothetical protein